jgi:hypothetical protein
LNCGFNVAQIADSGSKLMLTPILKELDQLSENYSDPIRIQIINASLWNEDISLALEKASSIQNLVRSNEKNSRYFTSFIRFYYPDFSKFFFRASELVLHVQHDCFSRIFLVTSQMIESGLVDTNTNSEFFEFQKAVKKKRSKIPSEYNNFFDRSIDRVLDISPQKPKKKNSVFFFGTPKKIHSLFFRHR